MATTQKRSQWTPLESAKMWSYIDRTLEGLTGDEEMAEWFNNMKKEIGGPYSDITFKRHFKKEMLDYVSDTTKEVKKRIKYAFLSRISCSEEVLKEFESHFNVDSNDRGKILAYTEIGSTDQLFAVKNCKRKAVETSITTLPSQIPIVSNTMTSSSGAIAKVKTLKTPDLSLVQQSSTDLLLSFVGTAIKKQTEKEQDEIKKEEEEEVEGEMIEEQQDEALQPEEIQNLSNFIMNVLTSALSSEVNQVANALPCSTSSDRYSASPQTQESSSPRKHSTDQQFDEPIYDANTYDVGGNHRKSNSSVTNMSDDQQASVDTARGTAIVSQIHQLDRHTIEKISRATSSMGMNQQRFSSIVAEKVMTESVEGQTSHSGPTQMENRKAKREHNVEIKKEVEEVPAKRAKADVLKQSHLASSSTRSLPPDTTVCNYLQDLISFLRKLNQRNEKLDEFIEVMEDVVSLSNKRKQKMSYSDVQCSLRRLFNSFKNNSVIAEGMDTDDISCCYDRTYFDLKIFLVSFKKFVSNYDTILDEFGQLRNDIEDEIGRCEEEGKRGKQELLNIEDIIGRVTIDFDQFGLMKEYKAEVEKRRSAKESCSSSSR